MLGCTANELHMKHGVSEKEIPEEIMNLLDRKFCFGVRFNPDSVKRGRPNFNVISVDLYNPSPKTTPDPSQVMEAHEEKIIAPAPHAQSSAPKTPSKPLELAKKITSSTSRGKEIAKNQTTKGKTTTTATGKKRNHGEV